MAYYSGLLLILKDSTPVYGIDSAIDKYPSDLYHIINSNNFISIWADPEASLTSGRFYTTAPEALFIIDSGINSVVDRYSVTEKCGANELLVQTDIVDLNVKG